MLPVALAVRYIQRLTTRDPRSSRAVDVTGACRAAYLLTSAGRRELARLERRIPATHADAAPQMLRLAAGRRGAERRARRAAAQRSPGVFAGYSETGICRSSAVRRIRFCSAVWAAG